MQRVVIARNPFDNSTWEDYETADVRQLLTEQFETWPSTARIYHGVVAVANDVTPTDEDSIEALADMEGPFIVVVYPGTPLIIAIVAIVAVVVLAAAIYFLMPKVPAVAAQRNQIASSNNSLSDRGNQPRIGSRVEDIFGHLKAFPSLLSLPWRKFVNNVEVEVCYMCIGRGAYDVTEIKDDTTPYAQIGSASLAIYPPYTSPNSGAPQLTIGAAITDALVTAKRFTTVDGQVLKPSQGASTFSVGCTFTAPNLITAEPTIEVGDIDPSGGGPYFENVDLTQYFNAGDTINVFTEIVGGLNLSGNYLINSVTPLGIVLVSPATVNPGWSSIPGGATGVQQTSMGTSGSHYIGPFTINVPGQTEVFCNFVAVGGIYKDDGTNQYPSSVTVQIELTPTDNNGTPTGAPAEIFNATLIGSSTEKNQVGLTVSCVPTFTGPCNVRAIRTSSTDTAFKGQVVDEVKWRDVYGAAPAPQAHFGNVTTVYARTVATTSALAVKDRKLNMLVTRKVPIRTGPTTFGALTASTSADDIMCAIALDPYIGNRPVSELDVDGIYNTIAAVKSYFHTDECGQFSYTFDDNNLSFEETFQTVAGAVFSQAYRRGNIIRLSFEKQTVNSTLLFNHRNKVPDSEVRTINFGRIENTDGIEYNYVSPLDDAPLVYYIPNDRSAVNPKKIDGTGVRSNKQAFIHAWRAWGKITYQNLTTNFEALKEAELLVLGDRILVADNTRSNVQDGEVIAQSVLTLTLSQKVTLVGGESIFLQLSNATVQSIPITAGPAANQVILSLPPTLALALDPNQYARTPYQIVGSAEPRGNAFLLAERTVAQKDTRNITAINYDNRYYAHDLDFFLRFDETNTYFDNTVGTWDSN